MNDFVDLEARERIAELERKHQELSSAFWGDEVRRDNGLRSEVAGLKTWRQEFEKRFTEAMAWAKHLWEVDRENECHGLKALAEYEAGQNACEDQSEDEEVQVTVARINARVTFWAAAVPTLIGLAGQIFLAVLISKLQKGG